MRTFFYGEVSAEDLSRTRSFGKILNYGYREKRRLCLDKSYSSLSIYGIVFWKFNIGM